MHVPETGGDPRFDTFHIIAVLKRFTINSV